MEEDEQNFKLDDNQVVQKNKRNDDVKEKASSSKENNSKKEETKESSISSDEEVSQLATSNPTTAEHCTEANCVICLDKVRDKAIPGSCFHEFCFQCLVEWSKHKNICPLCKTTFNKIVHNVKSNSQYDEYYVENHYSDSLWTLVTDRTYRYFTPASQRISESSRVEHSERRGENEIARPRIRHSVQPLPMEASQPVPMESYDLHSQYDMTPGEASQANSSSDSDVILLPLNETISQKSGSSGTKRKKRVQSRTKSVEDQKSRESSSCSSSHVSSKIIRTKKSGNCASVSAVPNNTVKITLFRNPTNVSDSFEAPGPSTSSATKLIKMSTETSNSNFEDTRKVDCLADQDDDECQDAKVRKTRSEETPTLYIQLSSSSEDSSSSDDDIFIIQ